MRETRRCNIVLGFGAVWRLRRHGDDRTDQLDLNTGKRCAADIRRRTILRDEYPRRIVGRRGSRCTTKKELMRGIAWPLVGLKHPICPAVPCRQGEVGIEQATLAAVAVVDRRIVDIHELGIAGNRASESVLCAYGRNRHTGAAGNPTVGVLKIESADGAIQIRPAITVVQIEGGGQRNWLQGLAPAACVYVSGSDFILVRARSATGAEAAQALKKIVRRSVLLHNHYHVLDRVVW